MNINTFLVVLSILFAHYTFDFILQSHWMAANKSKNNAALRAHVAVYTIGLILVAIFLWDGHRFPTPMIACKWVILNAILHWCTDYVSSRLSSKLFNKDWHNFFVVIGGDQLIHYATLFGTLTYYSGTRL